MANRDQTVFIVDDDEAIRESLRFLMKSIGLQSEIYGLGSEFLAAYDPARAGCLILDIRMPVMSGLDLQKGLAQRHSTLPIIFITGHGDVPMAVEAMREGAVDFLQKPFRDQDLIDRVHKALAQDKKTRIQLRERDKIAQNLKTLTEKERRILDRVVVGKSNKFIAAELFVSQRTVEVHRAHIMEKLEAETLAHLVRMVMEVESG